MRATIDVSPAVNGKAGLGRYAASLAACEAREHPGHVHLFANVSRAGHWPDALNGLPRTTVKAGYKPWRMLVWIGQMSQMGWDRLLPQSDVFHATEHLLLPLRGTRTVLTVHDLIYKLFPQHQKKLNYWYLNLTMPLYVRRADHIITVSQSSKRDLMAEYGTPSDKISVVYEAAAPHFKPQPPEKIDEVRARYGLPERYLLTVGVIEPRKNLARLVEVLSVLRRDEPGLRLVVVGPEGWLTGSFYEAIERYDQHDAVIRPGYIPDDDLPAVYAGSTVSALASVYEGFGLPVLEAMACGAPVACSGTSSVGEIAGDAALLFDPESVDEMAGAIRRLLQSGDLREEVRQWGFKRAAQFSWERAARETWAVYRQVVGE